MPSCPAGPQRFDAIDALRGLAALYVIAGHSAQQVLTLTHGLLFTVIAQARYSVQIFFVISAFTLFLSLSRHPSEHSTRDFLIRRFFRIAPLFWVAMVFYLVRNGLGPRIWLGDAPGITLSNILATATFTNGFYPYWINSIVPGGWSVAVEMVFYLTVPFLFRWVRSLRAAWINAFVWLAVGCLVLKAGQRFPLIPEAHLWNSFLAFWLPSQMPLFAIGVVLFFIFVRLPSIPQSWRKCVSVLLLTVCAGAAVGLSFCDEHAIQVHFMFGLVFVSLIVALLLHPFSLFVNRATIYIGKISFSTYLVHDVMLSYGNRLFFAMYRNPDWKPLGPQVFFVIVYGLVLAGTLVIASLTYRWIEVPGQALGRRVIAKLSDKPVPSPLDVKPAA